MAQVALCCWADKTPGVMAQLRLKAQTATAATVDRSTDLKIPATLTELIPAAKREEYIAAFGSQTKLPRTPLLPGYM